MFWTVVLEKTLESLLDCKEIQPVHPKGNQSWIFIGRTNAEMKLRYFGHLMWRTDSLEKTLMLGKIEGRRRRGWQGWDGWMASLTQWTWVWASSRSWWWTGKPGMLQSMGHKGLDMTEQLNWTECEHWKKLISWTSLKLKTCSLQYTVKWKSKHRLKKKLMKQFYLIKDWLYLCF